MDLYPNASFSSPSLPNWVGALSLDSVLYLLWVFWGSSRSTLSIRSVLSMVKTVGAFILLVAEMLWTWDASGLGLYSLSTLILGLLSTTTSLRRYLSSFSLFLLSVKSIVVLQVKSMTFGLSSASTFFFFFWKTKVSYSGGSFENSDFYWYTIFEPSSLATI